MEANTLTVCKCRQQTMMLW